MFEPTRRLIVVLSTMVLLALAAAFTTSGCSDSDTAAAPATKSVSAQTTRTATPTASTTPTPPPTAAAPATKSVSTQTTRTATPTASTTPTPAPTAAALQQPSANLTDGCVDSFDAELDYFPSKSSLDIASNFSIEYHRHYKILTVKEPFAGGSPKSYVLVQCGTPTPQLDGDLADTPVLQVPIETIFTQSTTHLPPLVELGHLEALTGVSQKSFISSQPVLDRIAQGHVVEFAPNFEIDAELVIEAAPSVLMASDVGPSQAHDTLANAGVDVLWNGEWLEPTPLGRAEWLKMTATLFNEEARANKQFQDISDTYAGMVERTAAIPENRRPTVMTGLEFGGIYYASGGGSFAAQLINDAGATYVWSDDDGTGSIETDIETQLERAGDADFWINAGAFWHTLSDVANADGRYTNFKPYKTGQVWTNNLALNEAGANDYFERGVTRPDLVLADLISIFHPSLLVGHEPLFYRQLPAQ